MDFLSVLNFIQNLLIFLVGLSILVLIHEFGHFWAARRAGIIVEEFGLGFPPSVFSKKINGTIYSLNAIPIGGFVRLYGEDHSVEVDKKVSFYHQSRWARTQVIIAGVIMNVLLGIAVFTVLYSIIGVPTSSENKIAITGVEESSPADKAGLRSLDRVVAINKKAIASNEELKAKAKEFAGQEIEITIERSPVLFLASAVYIQGEVEKFDVKLTPRVEVGPSQGPIGVGLFERSITFNRTKFYPWYLMPLKSSEAGLRESIKFVFEVVSGLGNTASRAFKGEVPQDVAGPIGIFKITESAASGGFLVLISLLGVLSINLAVINIMPFPALDGGRLLFILLEIITGKRVFPKVERIVHSVGMIILLGLIVLITFSDINRFILGRI